MKYNKKTKEFYITTRNKVYEYLKTNIGNAYTASVIINNLEEDSKNSSFKKYMKNNGGKILTEMSIDEYIQTTEKDGQLYYFFISD